MASSSSTSSTHNNFTYDLFISFRGLDTRENFVDHLHLALQHKNIRAYKDENIKKGKEISEELIHAIEDSRFHIVVFSKNYASSSWCLREILKIMECHRTRRGHVVYPVFFDLKPFEVRKQTGALEEAFAKHKNEACAGKWRAALTEAANVAGWEVKNTCDGHEAIIQKVVDHISLNLYNSNVEGKLIRMETPKKDVLSYIKSGIDDTMASIKEIAASTRVAFGIISSHFEGKSFDRNVSIVQKANPESYQHGVIELTQIQHKMKRH